MGELLERDELVLVSLTLDGRTVGVEYAFRRAGTVAPFQTGFDPALEAAGPGHLMGSHVIEDAIGRGARTVDFLRGDYPYKASYASDERRNVTLDGPLRAAWLSPIRLAAPRRARRAAPPRTRPCGPDYPPSRPARRDARRPRRARPASPPPDPSARAGSVTTRDSSG